MIFFSSVNLKNILNLNKLHFNIGVAILDGLLYVIGGESDESDDTVEIYNPITNTWTMEILSKRGNYGGVVVNRPPYLK